MSQTYIAFILNFMVVRPEVKPKSRFRNVALSPRLVAARSKKLCVRGPRIGTENVCSCDFTLDSSPFHLFQHDGRHFLYQHFHLEHLDHLLIFEDPVHLEGHQILKASKEHQAL